MRLYMWTRSHPFDEASIDVAWAVSRAQAYADRKAQRYAGVGYRPGPLVTVDLPEPGTTKGKRKGKKT